MRDNGLCGIKAGNGYVSKGSGLEYISAALSFRLGVDDVGDLRCGDGRAILTFLSVASCSDGSTTPVIL